MTLAASESVQLIETMRVEPGNLLPLLSLHMRRCRHSCHSLGFVWPGTRLIDDIRQCADGLPATGHHRIRLLLSADGRYAIQADPLPTTPTPVRLHLQPDPLHVDPQRLCHKTTRRTWYEAAQRWLQSNPEYFDVVFFNARGEMTEGSRCNLYIKKEPGGPWLTPPLSAGLLPGVQRQALLDDGRIQEAPFTREDFLNATALRISNALRGWLPAILAD